MTATDSHLIQAPGPTAPVPAPHAFSGIIDGSLSADVTIQGQAAATVTSTATNSPAHVPLGGAFVNPPTNRATIISGSATVLINGKPAARSGDKALTCNDPLPLPAGSVVAASTVRIGG